MTLTEALVNEVQIDVSAATIEKVLLDKGLIGTTVYDPATHQQAIDMAAIDVLTKTVYSSVSEGGYSITFNRDAVLQRIASLYKKYDLANPNTPGVRGASVW